MLPICKLQFPNGSYRNGVCRALWAQNCVTCYKPLFLQLNASTSGFKQLIYRVKDAMFTSKLSGKPFLRNLRKRDFLSQSFPACFPILTIGWVKLKSKVCNLWYTYLPKLRLLQFPNKFRFSNRSKEFTAKLCCTLKPSRKNSLYFLLIWYIKDYWLWYAKTENLQL